MFATPAFAQTAGSAAAAPGGDLLSMLPMLVGFVAIMYFFMIRPQQQRAKQHKAMLAAMKRNDTVVLSSGIIGKITRVEEAEVMVEIATGVNVRVVKAQINEVRAKGEPAPANDKAA
ncbi:preprotein translocase subunit YajC [Asticcacaulis sp. EMRT-3]|uniref:preprotein translocase subunit YajC n=1 Tax=Asticcacaulis sp. EMRT-3 TaxID=3040349 RepID=UPI0024AFBF3E|nr:preprotein translocase subunit YajC [Asticcacaulis sp. EMRT-3]MDI7774426.1 preprotein translocase subunit YajC [Asticcacaulis sp. EMRT-3]